MDQDPQPQPQPPIQPPIYPTAPTPVAAPVPVSISQPQQVYQQPMPEGNNPGKGLGIASLVTSLVGLGLVGIVLGIIGLKKSKTAGMKNGLATAGIILGIISTILVTLVIVLVVTSIASVTAKCNELGEGVHTVGGITYSCGAAATAGSTDQNSTTDFGN
ncbi:MAG: DUF4190 domain-containing protein [Candidatus Saccharibacteria bacterium]